MRQPRLSTAGWASDITDGAAWAVLLTLLWFVPIGIVSGDGLAQSVAYLRGGWRSLSIGVIGANPDHNPWRFLAELKYPQAVVQRVVETGHQIRPAPQATFPAVWVAAPTQP
jgi:hypothetical protein